MCVLLWAGNRAIKHLYRQRSATGWLCDHGDNGRSDGASPYRPAGDGPAVVGVIAAGADAWLKEITAQARTSPAKVFSVSVPLNHLYSPDQAFEIEVHGHRPARVRRCAVGQPPDTFAGFSPCGTDGPQGPLRGGCRGVDEAGDRWVGGHRPEHGRLGSARLGSARLAAWRHPRGSPRPARPPGPRPAGSCPGRAPPEPSATASVPLISRCPNRSCGRSRPAARPRPARPPPGRRPRCGHAGRTRYACSPGECFFPCSQQDPNDLVHGWPWLVAQVAR
jgi:hypothetical protein